MIGDVTEMVGGGTPDKKNPAYWDGDIPWASVKDLKGDVLSKTIDSITPEGVSNSSTRIIPANSLIVSTRMAVGKAVINTIPVAINQDLKALTLSNDVDLMYLFYLFKSKVEYFESVSTGATVKGIKIGHIRSLKIPLPPLPTQQRIATKLDAIDRLRAGLRREIAAYGELGESLFLEMFGDPAFNPNGFKSGKLADYCVEDGIKCGPFGTQLAKSEFVEEGVPIWGIPQVNSSFEKKPTEYVTFDKSIQLKKYSVKPFDIVMSRKGNVGKCAVYPKDWNEGILHSDVLRIRCDESIANPIFLAFQFKISRELNTQVANVSSGAIMAGINVTKLKKIEPQFPALSLQTQFADRITAIEALKQRAEAALAEADALFGAEMQSVFG